MITSNGLIRIHRFIMTIGMTKYRSLPNSESLPTPASQLDPISALSTALRIFEPIQNNISVANPGKVLGYILSTAFLAILRYFIFSKRGFVSSFGFSNLFSKFCKNVQLLQFEMENSRKKK